MSDSPVLLFHRLSVLALRKNPLGYLFTRTWKNLLHEKHGKIKVSLLPLKAGLNASLITASYGGKKLFGASFMHSLTTVCLFFCYPPKSHCCSSKVQTLGQSTKKSVNVVRPFTLEHNENAHARTLPFLSLQKYFLWPSGPHDWIRLIFFPLSLLSIWLPFLLGGLPAGLTSFPCVNGPNLLCHSF